jgi:protein gp37
VFCASLADVFDAHPDLVEPRARLFRLIRITPNLDWLLLTKRPENIAGMLPPDWDEGYPNVWLGTTVEDERVGHRVDALSAIPAAIRFLSCEPLIGALDLRGKLDEIDWVIVGGESGAKARVMQSTWARAIIDTAKRQGVAIHVKQLGTFWSRTLRGFSGDRAGGDVDRWPMDLRIQEFPPGSRR